MHIGKCLAVLACSAALAACGGEVSLTPTSAPSPTAGALTPSPEPSPLLGSPTPTPPPPTPTATAILTLVPPLPTATPPRPATLAAEPVLQGLAFPASFVFAPDGRLFFSERLTGRVRVVKEGVLLPEPLLSVPVVTLAETGLLGLALHPDFAAQPYLYAYYTYRDGHGRIWNRVSRWRDMDGRAGAEEVLLDHIPAASIHNGGAIAFGPDGKLYIPTGDAAQAALAQERLALNGKVLRMAPDGSVPEDNPFPGSLVFTLGHRNMFGLAFHPLTGVPYITENGTTRDDEINRLLPGRNYGWPTVLGKAGDARFVDPLLTFTPNIAPTGLAFYTGGSLPGEIANSLFFGAFNTGMLYRVLLKGPDFLEVERFEPVLRTGTGGIIDVVMGPDGFLYFSTPSGIFRVVASP